MRPTTPCNISWKARAHATGNVVVDEEGQRGPHEPSSAVNWPTGKLGYWPESEVARANCSAPNCEQLTLSLGRGKRSGARG